jgi:hypothetical protein
MDKNVRNLLIMGGVVIAAIVVLGFINSLLSAIVPMAIVAVIAFILGRLSTRMNLLKATGSVLGSLLGVIRASSKAASKAAAARPAPQKPAAKAESAPVAIPVAEEETESPAETDDDVSSLNLAIETEEDLQAKTRRLEEEVARRNVNYDPQAAIEERKRRLLGKTED